MSRRGTQIESGALKAGGRYPAIRGCCPMGCGETLCVGEGGHITCSLLSCPNPSAAADILADRETEHVVVLGESTFSITHPLRERIGGALHECGLHAYLAGLDGPPRQPGWYRASEADGRWQFARKEEQ